MISEHTARSKLEASIARLSEEPSSSHRIEFYRQLTSGRLFLVTRKPVEAPALNAPFVLANDTHLELLTVVDPSGAGHALAAFTSRERVRARRPNETCHLIEVEISDILKHVLDGEFTGIIINPAGPWAGVPRQDVERILKGAW